MDIGRFLALLTTQSLYFARADTLGDALEGTITSATVEQYHRDGTNPMFLPGFRKQVAKIRELLLQNMMVSCWHMNEHESMAMWQLYADQGKGLAIRSNYLRLIGSLSQSVEPFHVGQVSYIDYGGDTIVGKTLLAPFIYKQKALEHERELRAVIGGIPIRDSEIDWSAKNARGILVRTDLAELIESVVLAPKTEAWIADALSATMRRFGIERPVLVSSVNRAPIFG